MTLILTSKISANNYKKRQLPHKVEDNPKIVKISASEIKFMLPATNEKVILSSAFVKVSPQ